MIITFIDKLRVLFQVWSCIPMLPNKYKFYILLKPMEATRYTEFAYILKFLKKMSSKQGKILDVSSPFIMSYIFSRNNTVIKTDIYEKEKRFIKPFNNLKFELQDATKLTYKDNTFDFVYSISVIEHIYEKYAEAVKEMIRVAKPYSYIYLSFPASVKKTEEWLDADIYSNQFRKNNKIFFQYRFDEVSLKELLGNLKGTEIIHQDIFWEKEDGLYELMIRKMRMRNKNKYINFLKESFINFKYGFFILDSTPHGFDKAKNFGNVSIIIRKL